MSTEGLLELLPSDEAAYGRVLKVFKGPDGRPKAWRLTEAGSAHLEGTHKWLLRTFFVSVLATVLTAAALYLAYLAL